MDWKRWTALNHELLDQWRELLAREPDLSTPLPTTAPAEDRDALRLWSELSDDVLCVFETGRGCTWLSPNWERVTGHPVAKSLGADFYRHIPPHMVKSFIATLQSVLTEDSSAQSELYQHPFQVKHAGGTCRWYGMKLGSPRKLENGQDQVTCRLQDIQMAIEAQRALEKATRERELALKARSEFLNGMSHDLRTPLNAILGFTQIMESGMYGQIANEQYCDYLRHIRESGYELLAQIDDVMHIASIDAGEASLARGECDLYALLTEAVDLHERQAKDAQVAIHCMVEAGDYSLNLDRIKLLHAVSHLLSNALRSGRPGGQIGLTARVNDNNELCIRIRDDGLGIPSKKLQTLIAALTQEDSWSARGANGLGVGLPLAQELVRLHGGYITLESTPGKGTCVTLHLPTSCIVTAPTTIFTKVALAS